MTQEEYIKSYPTVKTNKNIKDYGRKNKAEEFRE